ncbi:hypothetical protein CEJ86_05440 [Sinorhizobium meliloti]|uniref:Uncharacterized protein n=1 Tax=Rhizobium meliloti TaxID=382 RepID=A0A2J0Z6V7_RHIML|nr:hypothetical protein CEJ86_05440 [Sinorhizobium meliloti]
MPVRALCSCYASGFPNIGSDCPADALKLSDTLGGLRWPILISDERSAPSWTSKGEAIHE